MLGFRIDDGGAGDAPGAIEFAGLSVTHADWLPAVRLEHGSGETFGVLLGWPIDAGTWRFLSDPVRFAQTPGGLDSFHRGWLENLRGSWIAVAAIGGQRRAYLDPFGSFGLVFDPAARLAGGTAADVLSRADYEARLDHALRDVLKVESDGWLPAGLTAHRGIERLMVNHALDLDTFTQRRFGRFADAPLGSGGIDAHLDTIADEIAGVAAAIVASDFPAAMGLTGGADSRMMLAALRERTADVLFYTVEAPGADFDLIRARELAVRQGLRHRVLPLVRADGAAQAEWDRRVGHCVATANRFMHPSVAPLADHICLGGLGGEVGRCFLWRDGLRPPATIDALYLVDALKLARMPALVERIAAWLEELNEPDPLRLLDIAYIELRMGSWAFAQSCSNPLSRVLHPLGSAAALRAMLALPPSVRANDGMIDAVIARRWPELLDLPINRYGDWRDITRQAARFLNPGKVARKARQIARTRLLRRSGAL